MELSQHAKLKKVSLRRSLLNWFRAEARNLPWRRTNDPYKVWLSEILLQQTRVETVIPYYERFLQQFPTVDCLANADIDDVLKLWEGLGYYRRAQNLHKAAQAVVEDHGGVFPDCAAGLLKLPGIGRYTAGAIASIAYGEQAPILDGNVKRVLARVLRLEDSIDSTQAQNRLWDAAEVLVRGKDPGAFNEAMMELGARICLPKSPKCGECPVAKVCEAQTAGMQHLLPIRNPKKQVPHVQVVAGAIHRNGRYLLGQRPPDGMLGGLWEFPGGKVEPGETHQEALRRELIEELGIETEIGDLVTSVNHAYTHLRVTIHLYLCTLIGGRPKTIYHSAIKWVPRSQFSRYAFPAANHKFLNLL